MSRVAQAFASHFCKGVRHLYRQAPVLIVAAMPLAGCASGGFDLARTEIDQSSLTGALPNTGTPPDAVRVSDEATIRNAVSSADPDQAKVQPLAWANADTGSRGAISALVESKEDGLLCRKFTTTRESFDGVALYQGKACMAGPGQWQMLAFRGM